MEAYGPYAIKCPKCGGVAYWLRRKAVWGDMLDEDILVKTDGMPPKRLEEMQCGTCGAMLLGALLNPNADPLFGVRASLTFTERDIVAASEMLAAAQ